MRLQAFRKKFREIMEIPGGREKPFGYDLSGDAMVGMVDADAIREIIGRVTGDQNIRANLANYPGSGLFRVSRSGSRYPSR